MYLIILENKLFIYIIQKHIYSQSKIKLLNNWTYRFNDNTVHFFQIHKKWFRWKKKAKT
jgi:hypothetical protein